MNDVLANGSRPHLPHSTSSNTTTASTSSAKGLIPSLEPPPTTTDSEIRCICEFTQDDGFTIQCDKCYHWLHGICVKINEKNVPDTFICYYCEGRAGQSADVKRAKDIQQKRLDAEARKILPQPKRPTGISHRKKELNGTASAALTSSHSRTQSGTIAQPKPQSPKDPSQQQQQQQQQQPYHQQHQQQQQPLLPPQSLGQQSQSQFQSPLQQSTSSSNSSTSTSSKPRGRQRPASSAQQAHHTALPDTSASPDHRSPTGKSPSVERELTCDTEVSADVYAREFTALSSNTVLLPELDSQIKIWAHDGPASAKSSAPTPTTSDGSSLHPWHRYSKDEFRQLVPLAYTVRWVSSPEELSALGFPLIRLVADAPSQPSQYVMECVGEIGSKSTYMQDSLNQYHRIRHPKAFVIFHPDLPIYVDARRRGSLSRFARRSCKPNLSFETVTVDSTDVRFAFYARESIDRGDELTLEWDWDPALPFTKALADWSLLETLEPQDFHKMSSWAETITSAVGDCACADRSTCLIARLKGEVPAETKPSSSKRSSTTTTTTGTSTKAGNKRRWKEMNEGNVNNTNNNNNNNNNSHHNAAGGGGGREVSPEKHDPEAKRRSSSTSSHRKSESRDRTPTFPSADILQSSVLTDQHASAREQRKMKETINLIEKLTNSDTAHNRKRVKRPNPASSPATTAPTANSDASEKLVRTVHASPSSAVKATTMTATTATTTTAAAATMAADTTQAFASHQSTMDAVRSTQSSPRMTNGAASTSVLSKTSYVDGGVQTESDPAKPHPPPLPTTLTADKSSTTVVLGSPPPQGQPTAMYPPSSRKMRILAQFRAQTQQRDQSLKQQQQQQQPQVLSIVKEEPRAQSPFTSPDDDQDVPMADAEPLGMPPNGGSPIKVEAVAAQPLTTTTTTTTTITTPPSPTSLPEIPAPQRVGLSVGPLSEGSDKANRLQAHDESDSAQHLAGQHEQNKPSVKGSISPTLSATAKPGNHNASARVLSPMSPAPHPFPNSAPPTRKKMSLSDYTRMKAESSEKDKFVKPMTTVMDAEPEVNGTSAAAEPGPMDLDPSPGSARS